ncbi:Uncharacterised protein [Citrobacter freundii]|nr:Uncharacterised protein [Citrobacter freundii]
MCVGYGLLGPFLGLVLTGRHKRRSNLFQTDLSLTPVTYFCKFLGLPSLTAFLQLELFRVKIEPNGVDELLIMVIIHINSQNATLNCRFWCP